MDVDTGQNLGPNKVGELRVKTNLQMTGYYEADSSKAWDDEGYINTGDMVYYDKDFCFYVVDRLKETIKYQGWHILPAKIEMILSRHPCIKAAVVLGVQHDEDGEHPLGVVELRDDALGITSEELLQYIDKAVDDKQRLRAGLIFVNDLPYTPTGKINRRLLKQQIFSKCNKKTVTWGTFRDKCSENESWDDTVWSWFQPTWPNALEHRQHI